MRDTIISSHRLLAVLGDTDIVSFVAMAQHFGGERHKKWTSKAGESKKNNCCYYLIMELQKS